MLLMQLASAIDRLALPVSVKQPALQACQHAIGMVAKRFAEEVEVNLPGKTGLLRLHDCFSIYDMRHDMALLDDSNLTDCASGFPADLGL
jgi:hypothetical protein